MAETSKAEELLDSLAPTQRLIARMQSLINDASVLYGRMELSKDTKAHIDDFKSYIQDEINELTIQRERTISLIKRIPDPNVETVLKMRYGLFGSGKKLMPWFSMPDTCILKYQPYTNIIGLGLIT